MDTLKNHFNQQIKRNGINCTINNKDSAVCFFREIEDKSVYGADTKYLFISIQSNIKQGDVIEVLGKKWLVIQMAENYNNVYYKVIVRRITYNIKVKFADGIYEMPSIIEDKIQNTSDGKILSIIDGKIEVLTQLNNISKKIRYDWNFITMGNKWEVEGFSYCEEGLYKIYATKEQFNDKDDIENEIADNPKSKDVYMNDIYNIEVNLDNNNLKIGQTVQLNVTCKKNGIEDKTPIVTYKSNNENVVDINENGLITGISEGITTIYIIYNNVEKVITINITKTVYNLEVITTNSKLKTNETLQIQTKCTIDGIEDLNPHREYSSSDTNVAIVNELGLITAKNEGVSTITIKYHDIEKYIKIEVKNSVEPPKIELFSEDGEFTVDITIDKTFSAKYFVNGIEDTTAKFTFSIENKVKYDNRHRLLPLLATIKSFTNDSCILKANNKAKYGYIILSAFLVDNSLKIEKEIKVVNPFS